MQANYDKLQWRLSQLLSCRKSRVEIGGIVEEDGCLVVQCRVGVRAFMVVFKNGFDAQVYVRI